MKEWVHGYADLPNERPNRLDTRFGTASAGKAFVAVGVLQLVEKGAATPQAAEVMRAAISAQALSIPIPEQIKDAIRARTMKSMLLALARSSAQQGGQKNV